MMMRAALVVFALSRLARADASLPSDELRTHAPPPPVKTESVAPAPVLHATADETPAPRTYREPRGPLDFIDATLESEDLVSRFRSARPAVKIAPPRRKPPTMKEGAARTGV